MSAPFSHASCERRATIARPRSYTLTLAPHLVYWSSNLLELLRNVEMTTSFTWQAVGSWWIFLTDEDVAQRSSGGGGIGGALVDAGVKAVKVGDTVRKKAGWNKGRKRESRDLTSDLPPELQQTGDAPTLRKLGGVLREVPCTFEDVAWSPDLQDRDRGYLGGLLRFISKCSDPEDTKHHQLLAEHADTPLSEFLTTVYPLPPFTIASIHSLTLLPTPPEATPLRTALDALIRHVSSIGRIPDIRSAAALTIAYGGSSELCQVWSRGAAVAGGINVLSRGMTSITPGDDGKHCISLSNGEVVTALWVLTTATTATAAPSSITSLAKGIFVISAPLHALFTKKFADDRIPPNAAVLTFPSGSLKTEDQVCNKNPVYIIAHASATGECGPGEGTCPPLASPSTELTLPAVLYTSTLSPQPVGYVFSELAVRRVLSACGEEGADISFVCRFTQEFATPIAADSKEDGLVELSPMSGDLAFDAGVVEECKQVYERIIGTKEGFLEMTEEMRRQYALAEEE